MIKIKRRGSSISTGKWNSNVMKSQNQNQDAGINKDLTCAFTELSVNEINPSNL